MSAFSDAEGLVNIGCRGRDTSVAQKARRRKRAAGGAGEGASRHMGEKTKQYVSMGQLRAVHPAWRPPGLAAHGWHAAACVMHATNRTQDEGTGDSRHRRRGECCARLSGGMRLHTQSVVPVAMISK